MGLQNVIHLFAPLTANCRDFHDHWSQAPDVGQGIEGRWAGEWISLASGHRGPLRCVIESLDGRLWRARFRASYSRLFRACYATDLDVQHSGERWTFSGESDLGALAGGVYAYEGEATTRDFVSRYRSKYDHGEFRLRRLPQ